MEFMGFTNQLTNQLNLDHLLLNAIEERSKQFQSKALSTAVEFQHQTESELEFSCDEEVQLPPRLQFRQGMTKFNFVFGVSNSTLGTEDL